MQSAYSQLEYMRGHDFTERLENPANVFKFYWTVERLAYRIEKKRSEASGVFD